MKPIIGALAVLASLTGAAAAGTISIQWVQTGQSNVSKTFTIADADIDRIVKAYQDDANAFYTGSSLTPVVATRAQVLQFVDQTWINITKEREQKFNTTPAVVPPPVDIH